MTQLLPCCVLQCGQDGAVVPGVVMGDMGRKTTGNDLDNAWLQFTDVTLPKDALLNRYADVVDDQYVQTTDVKPFAMIGQRLYTGRVAVAQAALTFTRVLFEKAWQYCDNKDCYSPVEAKMAAAAGTAPQWPPLSKFSHLNALFLEAEQDISEKTRFVDECERRLSETVTANAIPDDALVLSIAVAKVRSVEACIELCFRLKQEVGSYALMADSGFEHIDFLQCCKFAEGDSRILMQKMARDTLKVQRLFGRSSNDSLQRRCTAEPLVRVTRVELVTCVSV